MNPVAKNVAKFGLPLVVLAAAVGLVVLLVSTKKEPERKEKREQRVLVQTEMVEASSHRLNVQAAGEVVAARNLVVTPQVSGRLVWVNDKLVPGGIIRKGETLFRVDPADYRIAVEEAKTQLAQAEAQLAQERGRVQVAQREWELFKNELDEDQRDRDPSLALRKPQLESAKVAVDAAKARLKRAQLNLSRTSVEAPFDAFVANESADIGQLVGAQSQVASLVGTEKFWVRMSVPVEKISYISVPGVNAQEGSKAIVRQDAGKETIEREGKVVRLLGDLDPQGRMARVLVEIADPFGLNDLDETDEPKQRGIPLLLSSFVDVEVQGPAVDDLIEIPREAIRDGDKAFVFAKDKTLAVRPVDVIWERPDTILVKSGVKDGERVIVSPIATAVDGMKLRAQDDKEERADAASQGAKKPAEEASDE
ncbi:efflux RND transporter periplasmic adaptor subunit [Persicimonas caeni]|uniref:Efflux RND transporter periplasmic adaptor subunit n=1 Tax=Persicimonas caeni TaxID=2292766 RepID=A0A4Y6Q187_PERCE|nr:efflux RND transporter periplasmic adaptor subunit [Persicimonas caeni]QDG54209.1 efflux RND transporter periplasmic adaptor subunit [Persicimonas caeni]QED35430.1 efflux RND transporter periplasmic adaptor subunit [Persicimonas caeni]